MAPDLRDLPDPAAAPERARFFGDLDELELRLAIIDDRFERLASRPEATFQAFRVDTLGRMRSIALRARALEQNDTLEPHHRRRVAALLLAIRHRVGALDARHARFLERRPRRAVPSVTGVPPAPAIDGRASAGPRRIR